MGTPHLQNRLGFHYFPDSLHYQEKDLKIWLPELKSLGAGWLTLRAPNDRAIPETFLKGLLQTQIQPILHFPLKAGFSYEIRDFEILFNSYARWGVSYVALFDRPNLRQSWTPSRWAQAHLVERFLDFYLPLVDRAMEAGLIPVFPPLEPGGDYWDTAFLRAALEGMQRRGADRLLEKIVLGAYSLPGNRPLDWGVGGPERWPNARPYAPLHSGPDQRGFRIFDWYLALVQAVLGEPRSIAILAAGSKLNEQSHPDFPPLNAESHTNLHLTIAKLLNATTSEISQIGLEPISPSVICYNFWLLADCADSPAAAQAWYQPDGTTLPIVKVLKAWQNTRIERGLVEASSTRQQPATHSRAQDRRHPITHYLLLPAYEWGVPDWHLDAMKPFVKKYRPTVGFSIKEAALAARVTLVGGEDTFPAQIEADLKAAGCRVERICGDGTKIASLLASR